ncbi:UNVERIFIED_CONTAM: hypothetical protein NCL1_25685 [Trichonephila clavipes]
MPLVLIEQEVLHLCKCQDYQIIIILSYPRIKMGEALNSDNISNDCLICDKIGRSSELSSELGDIIKVTREEYQH